LFGDAYVPWQTYNHPQFGEIEIGGAKKNYIRNTPGFLMEEDAHRNMAFTLFHAYQTPKVEITEVQINDIGGGIRELIVTIVNTRAIPTHSAHDVKHKLEKPLEVRLSGADIVSGFILDNADFNLGKEQVFKPEVLLVDNIRGNGFVKVKWLLSDRSKNYSIEVYSPKSGRQKKVIDVSSVLKKTNG
jgi:hypothetical protein